MALFNNNDTNHQVKVHFTILAVIQVIDWQDELTLPYIKDACRQNILDIVQKRIVNSQVFNNLIGTVSRSLYPLNQKSNDFLLACQAISSSKPPILQNAKISKELIGYFSSFFQKYAKVLVENINAFHSIVNDQWCVFHVGVNVQVGKNNDSAVLNQKLNSILDERLNSIQQQFRNAFSQKQHNCGLMPQLNHYNFSSIQ